MIVYIVDDSQLSRELLAAMVKEFGYTSRVFNSGEELLQELTQQEEPAILLIDWLMPGMSGISILKYLDEHKPKCFLYKIMVSSKKSSTEIANALESGADDYVSKPFDISELKARVSVGVRILGLWVEQERNREEIERYTTQLETLAEERAKQLVHADRLSTIGTMSAGIAHEINNPATFIAVNIQTLDENLPVLMKVISGEGSVQEKKQAAMFCSFIPEILHEMRSGVDRIKVTASSIKEFLYKPMHGHSLFLLSKAVANVDKITKSRQKESGVTLLLREEFNGSVDGMQQEIEQVLINLVINAIDAIEETGTGGAVSLSTAASEEGVVITVEDTGPGIALEKREKLFTPFYTSKSVGKGTGLGLSISEKIVLDHKGKITIGDSGTLGGASFTIELPVEQGE